MSISDFSRGARVKLTRPTALRPIPAPLAMRRLSPEDAEAVGRLMYDAYLGSVDDAGETLEDQVAEARRTFGGAYGPCCGTLRWGCRSATASRAPSS